MSGGHEQVKDLLVEHLADDLGPWLTVVRGDDDWPLDPKMVAASDILPEGDDAWPCVLVSSTRMVKRTSMSATPTPVGHHIARYTTTVTVACRAVKERDADSAAAGRDRLLLAVRWLLMTAPGLGSDATCLLSDLEEVTDPVAVDAKGRPVALGRATFVVQATETVPDLGAIEVVDAAVTDLAVTTADGSLFTHTTAGYDGPIVYDAPGVEFDGAREYPPKP